MCVDESLRHRGHSDGAAGFSRQHLAGRAASFGSRALPVSAKDWAHCLQLMSGPAPAFTAPITIPSPSSTLQQLGQHDAAAAGAAMAAGQVPYEWGGGCMPRYEAPQPRARSDPAGAAAMADMLSGRLGAKAAQPGGLDQAEGELTFEQLMFARQESMEGLAAKCQAAASGASAAAAPAGPATPSQQAPRPSGGEDAAADELAQQHLAVLHTLAEEPSCGWEALVATDAREAALRLQAARRGSDAAPLVAELQRLGHDAQLLTSCSFSGSGRSSPTGAAQQPQPRRSEFTGYHVFILVEPPAEAAAAGAETLIVDPAFRSQFEIARPSPAYATLLGGMPPVFCGRRRSLRRLIKFVTGRASESFVSEGLDVPPWRKLNSMYGRWLLHDC